MMNKFIHSYEQLANDDFLKSELTVKYPSNRVVKMDGFVYAILKSMTGGTKAEIISRGE